MISGVSMVEGVSESIHGIPDRRMIGRSQAFDKEVCKMVSPHLNRGATECAEIRGTIAFEHAGGDDVAWRLVLEAFTVGYIPCMRRHIEEPHNRSPCTIHCLVERVFRARQVYPCNGAMTPG
jgi:hypothetical protein